MISYSRTPIKRGRPVTELLDEAVLADRIRSHPPIRAYSEYARAAPDIATKGPVYDARKRVNSHATCLPFAIPRGGHLSPAPTDNSRYSGLVHIDIDDRGVEDQRETLPDIPQAWIELQQCLPVRFLGHSLSGALWVGVATDNTEIDLHHHAWSYAISLIPDWIRPYVGQASSAVNGLRFLAWCPCLVHNPASAALAVPPPTAIPEVQPGVNRQPGTFSWGDRVTAFDSTLPWLGIEITLQHLAQHGQRRSNTVRLNCPAHSGSASSHHLSASVVDDRVLLKCFSDKCSASYATLAASVEKLIRARLSAPE